MSKLMTPAAMKAAVMDIHAEHWLIACVDFSYHPTETWVDWYGQTKSCKTSHPFWIEVEHFITLDLNTIGIFSRFRVDHEWLKNQFFRTPCTKKTNLINLLASYDEYGLKEYQKKHVIRAMENDNEEMKRMYNLEPYTVQRFYANHNHFKKDGVTFIQGDKKTHIHRTQGANSDLPKGRYSGWTKLSWEEQA